MHKSVCNRVCDYYFDSFKPLHSCQEAKNASAEKWLRAAIMTLFSMTIVIPLGFCILRCCITPVLSEDLQQTAIEVTAVATATLGERSPSSSPLQKSQGVLYLPARKEIREALRAFMTSSSKPEVETDTMRSVRNLLASHDFEKIKSYCENELTVSWVDSSLSTYTAAAIFAIKYAHLAASPEIFSYLCSKIDFNLFEAFYAGRLLFETTHKQTDRSEYLHILLNRLNLTVPSSDRNCYLQNSDECGLTLMHYAVLYEDQETQELLKDACPELMTKLSSSMGKNKRYPGFFEVGTIGGKTPLEFAKAFWSRFHWKLALAHITGSLPKNQEELFLGWDQNRGRDFSEVIAKIDPSDRVRPSSGLTLLHYAALFQKEEMAEQLKQQGMSEDQATLLDLLWYFTLDPHWDNGAYAIIFTKHLGEKVSPKKFPDACVDKLIIEYMSVRLTKDSCVLWGKRGPRNIPEYLAILKLLQKRLVEKGELPVQARDAQTDEEMAEEVQQGLDQMELGKLLGYVHRAHLEIGARYLFVVACQKGQDGLARQLLDLGLDPLNRADIELGKTWGPSTREAAINSPFSCLKELPPSEGEAVKKMEEHVRKKVEKIITDSIIDFPTVLGHLISEYVELSQEKAEEPV